MLCSLHVLASKSCTVYTAPAAWTGPACAAPALAQMNAFCQRRRRPQPPNDSRPRQQRARQQQAGQQKFMCCVPAQCCRRRCLTCFPMYASFMRPARMAHAGPGSAAPAARMHSRVAEWRARRCAAAATALPNPTPSSDTELLPARDAPPMALKHGAIIGLCRLLSSVEVLRGCLTVDANPHRPTLTILADAVVLGRSCLRQSPRACQTPPALLHTAHEHAPHLLLLLEVSDTLWDFGANSCAQVPRRAQEPP